jgi:hypothetical protein
VPQQQGVPLKQTKQQQPLFRQHSSVSQHDCRIAQHALSPLVQVMQQPSLVLSHLQMPQVRLHWQTVKPFNVAQHEHSPPTNDLHRFCRVARETSSSQTQ